MLGCLDEKFQSFLHVLRRKGGVVNTIVAVATAKAFWPKSLFRRMGFKKRTCTTSKPEIPELAKKEAKLIFKHQIAEVVERHSIPLPLVMNLDQTPLKYAPVSKLNIITQRIKACSN